MATEKSHKKMAVAILFLTALLVGSVLTLYHYRQRIPLSVGALKGLVQDSGSKGRVKCMLTTNMGGGHALRMKLGIPYEDHRQRADLAKKVPRFQHDLLMAMNQPEMEALLKDRNFRILKRQILHIINRSAEKPVGTVFLESFFYN
jgi:flagellar basal body-associated protein FliL